MTPSLRRLLHGPSPLGKAAMKLQRWRTGATTYEVRGKPYCDDPVPVSRQERAGPGQIGFSFEMLAPCRKCEKCRLFRKKKWEERMRRELAAHPRTWFLTLTFSPIHLAGILAESYAFPKLTQGEAIERAAYQHVQRYFKRLRKSGARFRYIVVFEYGEKQGRLHCHAFLHETLLKSTTKRLLQAQWRSIVDATLVKEGGAAASYVSKYMTKVLSKPRVSLNYGKSHTMTSPPLSSLEVRSKKDFWGGIND